jgi:hypothetical protein
MAGLLNILPAGRCKHYICEVEVSTNMSNEQYRKRGQDVEGVISSNTRRVWCWRNRAWWTVLCTIQIGPNSSFKSSNIKHSNWEGAGTVADYLRSNHAFSLLRRYLNSPRINGQSFAVPFGGKTSQGRVFGGLHLSQSRPSGVVTR